MIFQKQTTQTSVYSLETFHLIVSEEKWRNKLIALGTDDARVMTGQKTDVIQKRNYWPTIHSHNSLFCPHR